MLMLFLSMLETEEDKAWFTELYLRLHDVLYSQAMRVTRNREDAEDAMQKVWEKVIQKSEVLQAKVPEHQKAYLIVMTRHRCIDEFRRRKREKDKRERVIEQKKTEAADRRILEKVRRLLEKLDERYRIVLELNLLAGFTYREIADELDIPLSTVSTRIQRGKERLQKQLREEGLYDRSGV